MDIGVVVTRPVRGLKFDHESKAPAADRERRLDAHACRRRPLGRPSQEDSDDLDASLTLRTQQGPRHCNPGGFHNCNLIGPAARAYLWQMSFSEMQVFPQGLPFLHCLGWAVGAEAPIEDVAVPVGVEADGPGAHFMKWPFASRH